MEKTIKNLITTQAQLEKKIQGLSLYDRPAMAYYPQRQIQGG